VAHVFCVALLCVEEQSVQRPTMREVVQMLGELPKPAAAAAAAGQGDEVPGSGDGDECSAAPSGAPAADESVEAPHGEATKEPSSQSSPTTDLISI
jgi:hypothetical protein